LWEVKFMEIRKMSQSELDKAIKEELERAGGYDAWRRKGYANEDYTNEVAPEPPKRRPLSKSGWYADACTLTAEWRGISIEELFKQEPERYKQYCRLVLEELG
jgi:hypothetical protein